MFGLNASFMFLKAKSNGLESESKIEYGISKMNKN